MASKAFLEKAYLAYFGRPVDPTGLVAFANSTEAEVATAFSASPESKALFGPTFGAAQINLIYMTLFGRPAEPAGIDYWLHQVDLGLLTPTGAAMGILAGALNADITAAANKLAASAAFTTSLDTAAEIQGYAGNDAAAVARDFLKSITSTPATEAQVTATVANSTGIFAITAVADAVQEGGDIVFRLTLESAPATALTLNYNTTTGTASSADFVSAAGQVTFAVGQTVAFVTIKTVDDATVESAESLTLNLSGANLASAVTATATINDQADIDAAAAAAAAEAAAADAAEAAANAPKTLTLTAGTSDNLVGGKSGDLFIGQVTDSDQPTAANTLHASDIIDGGQGVDTLRVTADGNYSVVNGFTASHVENLEVRSYGSSVTLGLVNVTGLEKVISTNSTGDIRLDYVQNVVALDLTGNGTSAIDVDVNYVSDAVAGANDTQSIALNRFQGDWLRVGGGEDGYGIENLEIATAGRASSIYELDSRDVTSLTITGDQDLAIDYFNADAVVSIKGFVGGTADLSLGNSYNGVSLASNASVTTGNGDDSLYLAANGSGSVTVNVGNGDNHVSVGGYNSNVGSINITAGAGNDDVNVYLDAGEDVGVAEVRGNVFGDVTIDVGAGDDNYVYVDDNANNVSVTAAAGDNHFDIGNVVNNLVVTTAAGDDILHLNDAYHLTVDAGEGNNIVDAGYVETLAEVTTGAGDDTIDLDGATNATILAGAGTNNITVGTVSEIASVMTGTGNDTITMSSAGIIDVQAGDGNNTIGTNSSTADMIVSVTAGSGNDSAFIQGGNIVDVNLGDGINTVVFGSGTAGDFSVVTGASTDTVDLRAYNSAPKSLNLALGAGNDTVLLSNSGLEKFDVINNGYVAANYTIAGDDGADTLVVSGLSNVNAAATFANVTSVETLSIQNYYSGEDDSFNGDTLDGIATGANAAGVMTYDLVDTLGEDNSDFELTNISAGATVNVDYGHTNSNYWTDALATVSLATAGVLNLNVTTSDGGEDSGNLDLNIANVTTLNFVVEDTVIDVTGLNPTVQKFYSGEFNADAALTTLNITDTTNTITSPGEGVAVGFDDIYAKNLATINAGDLTQGLYLYLDDVADTGVTITSGSGNDDIYLEDADASMNVTTGAGDDYVYAGEDQTQGNTVSTGDGDDEVYLNGTGNDVIDTGNGSDFIFSGAGVDTIHAGAGDDTIAFNAADLTAADLLNGGEGDDTVVVNGSLGTVDDNFFRQWSSVETLALGGGGNDLTLGWIANNDAKLKTIFLSDNWLNGDTLNFTDDFTGAINVHLSSGEDGDTIHTSSVTTGGPSAINAFGVDWDVQGNDVLQGGNGIDTLFLEASYGFANLSGVTGFEKVTVQVPTAGQGTTITVGSDSVVADGKTLTVDASALVNVLTAGVVTTPAGTLTFDGSAETGTGAFNVTGGDGSDTITTGAGSDTIAAGAGNNVVVAGNGNNTITAGNGVNNVTSGSGVDTITLGDGINTVEAGAGNDTITAGNGANSVTAGGGADTITLGNGNNTVLAGADNDVVTTGTGDDTVFGGAGNDTIAAGNGINFITGGAGSDALSGGTGVDTYLFNAAADSSGLDYDTITGFASGDVIDLTGVAQLLATMNAATTPTGSTSTVTLKFIGSLSNATVANTALLANDTAHLNVVYVTGEKFLYVDANQDGVINEGDMSIELVGLQGSLTGANFSGSGSAAGTAIVFA